MKQSNTITSKGQVTIPAEIRRSLGLKTGELVRFKLLQNNQVVIEKNDWKQELGDLHKQVAIHLKKNHIKPLTDEQLDDAINQSAQKALVKRYHRGQ